jgi:hypothetical protein
MTYFKPKNMGDVRLTAPLVEANLVYVGEDICRPRRLGERIE